MLPPSGPIRPRRSFLLTGWLTVAMLPILFITAQVVVSSRNIVFWDEFDTALALILRMDEGADWNELLHRLFAVNNEHRMLTSRLMFAVSYWLTGTVNFHVIGAIGNLFLLGACLILVLSVKGWERRIRLGVVLAYLMFQLEHFESFLWSGASIDHFQVVMLGVGAIAALGRGARPGVILAVLLGFLGTFTLAHGSLIWPVGGALLWHQHRWRHLAAWCGCGLVVLAAFLQGFEFNPGHNIPELGAGSVGRLFLYWLALLGGPLTLGDAGFGPVAGVVLLVGLVLVIARGALVKAPVASFSVVFAVGALGMVAVGRSELASAAINSRYLVLGALAWALLIFLLLELATLPARPFRQLAWMMPALAAFNVSANRAFAPLAEGYIEVRDRAATAFMQYGEDGRGLFRLHPQERHADVLLRIAAERDVYELPPVSHQAHFPDAQRNDDIITYIDELVVNDRAVTAGGWAMLPGRRSERGDVYLVLRSNQRTLFFSTVTLQRPDVARAYGEPGWRLSGFRAVIERERLPAEDFEVGVLIADEGRAEYLMTLNQLLLTPGKERAVQMSADR